MRAHATTWKKILSRRFNLLGLFFQPFYLILLSPFRRPFFSFLFFIQRKRKPEKTADILRRHHCSSRNDILRGNQWWRREMLAVFFAFSFYQAEGAS